MLSVLAKSDPQLLRRRPCTGLTLIIS